MMYCIFALLKQLIQYCNGFHISHSKDFQLAVNDRFHVMIPMIRLSSMKLEKSLKVILQSFLFPFVKLFGKP